MPGGHKFPKSNLDGKEKLIMGVSWGAKISKNEPEPAATSSAVALRGKVEVDFGPGH